MAWEVNNHVSIQIEKKQRDTEILGSFPISSVSHFWRRNL